MRGYSDGNGITARLRPGIVIACMNQPETGIYSDTGSGREIIMMASSNHDARIAKKK
jgi:hypothetical protein